MTDAEKVYDEQIAPLLMQAGKIAEANGFALAAFCEWGPGESGSTLTLPAGASAAARLAYYGCECKGNADALIMATMKDARLTGHSSMCLQQLGVPTKPLATSPNYREGKI